MEVQRQYASAKTRRIIARTIKRLRKRKSETQQELADSILVSRGAISKWETGVAVPSIDTLILMCKHFDITFEELMKGRYLPEYKLIYLFNIIKDLPIVKVLCFFIIYFIALFGNMALSNNYLYNFDFKSNYINITKGIMTLETNRLNIDLNGKVISDFDDTLKIDIITKRNNKEDIIYSGLYDNNLFTATYVIENISKYYIKRNKNNMYIRITFEDEEFIEGKIKITRIDNKKRKETVQNYKVLNSYSNSVLLKDYYKKIKKN